MNAISISKIENLIYVIRGQKVMLDKDLASLFEIETKKFNQAVKRDSKRFPIDFMFQLNDNEINISIMRTFVKLRQLLASDESMADKIVN